MTVAETRDKDGVLDAREAGAFLREVLSRKGMQIQQLAERTTVPDPDYLSNLLSGRVNVGRSKHLPSIARALGLNPDEVKHINPNLIVQVVAEKKIRPIPLPDALAQAIELHSRRFPDLLDPAWQQYLAGFRWRHGEPDDPEAWLDLYRDLARAGIVPGGN